MEGPGGGGGGGGGGGEELKKRGGTRRQGRTGVRGVREADPEPDRTAACSWRALSDAAAAVGLNTRARTRTPLRSV